MSEQSLVIRLFGNSTQMRIVDFLLEFPINEFTTNEMIENIGMSKTTLYKGLDNLISQSMIKTTKRGKGLIISIDMDNPFIQTIKTAVSIASGQIAEKQLKNEKFLMHIKQSLKTLESLQTRKALLQSELKVTKATLKTMPIMKTKS